MPPIERRKVFTVQTLTNNRRGIIAGFKTGDNRHVYNRVLEAVIEGATFEVHLTVNKLKRINGGNTNPLTAGDRVVIEQFHISLRRKYEHNGETRQSQVLTLQYYEQIRDNTWYYQFCPIGEEGGSERNDREWILRPRYREQFALLQGLIQQLYNEVQRDVLSADPRSLVQIDPYQVQ